MIYGFAVVWEHVDRLINGLVNCVILSVLSGIVALILGSLVAILLMSSNRAVALCMQGMVDLMRCVPFLMLIYLVYYGLPHFGLNLDNWTSGLGALVLYNSAYMAEILRGIWRRLPKETIASATAFGFARSRLYQRIGYHHAFLAARPRVRNQLLQISKDP